LEFLDPVDGDIVKRAKPFSISNAGVGFRRRSMGMPDVFSHISAAV
jgi:hypothetical protein